jgi:hypothetical protein
MSDRSAKIEAAARAIRDWFNDGKGPGILPADLAPALCRGAAAAALDALEALDREVQQDLDSGTPNPSLGSETWIALDAYACPHCAGHGHGRSTWFSAQAGNVPPSAADPAAHGYSWFSTGDPCPACGGTGTKDTP